MKISIFGMGYVGVVTAACLAKDGHVVCGVDLAGSKVDMLNAGRSPIVEDEIGELVEAAVRSGLLRATSDVSEALAECELALVCVGTPSLPSGAPDNRYVIQVAEQIGAQLVHRRKPLLVVLRSTVLPGTVRKVIVPALERSSGRLVGDGFEVVFHPEFLREGTSVHDYYHPPKVVVGERVPGTGGSVLALYAGIDAPRIACELEIAETVKFADNIFHAAKITFANEIGQVCHAMGISGRKVMDIFCEDTKLNISPRYLKPGFAFGGSCLPKDTRAFISLARSCELSLPMIEGILPSNRLQIERAIAAVLQSGVRRIGLHGIAFKPGTDDLRESPLVELAERLLGKGMKLVCYDSHVQMARLLGGNRSYIEKVLPHLGEILTDDIQKLDDCEVILLGHAAPVAHVRHWLLLGRAVLDLTGNANLRQECPRMDSIV